MVKFVEEVTTSDAAHDVSWEKDFDNGRNESFIRFPSDHGTFNVLENVSDQPFGRVDFLLASGFREDQFY